MSFSKVSPCFTLPANQDNKSCILPCLTQKLTNHRQQIIHLVMPRTDTTKSQATNRTSCHASHRCQQTTGNNSYILAMPHTDTSESSVKGKSSRGYELLRANHRQQIIHLVLPRTDTAKSQATNLTSCHASHRCQQIECKKKK